MPTQSALTILRTMSERHSEIAQRHRAWTEWLMRITGKKISPLATDAGLSSTTLARMNEPDFNGFSQRVLNVVMKHYNVPGPEAWALGLSEDDAAPFEGPPPEFDLKKIAKSRKSADVWEVTSDALAALGFRRGEKFVLDLNEKPVPGDVVIAQHYDMSNDRAKTLLRLYTGHHLAKAQITGAPQEILTVDPGVVAIKGVVIARLWLRK